MKTLPLRELLRQPARVKKLTAAGHLIRVTDRGKPLWVLKSDTVGNGGELSGPERDEAIEAIFAELLSQPVSSAPSLCRTILESRK